MQYPLKIDVAEYATMVWHLVPPMGHTLDDMLKPDYWQHVATNLRPGHEIKVAEDRSFWAHLLVRDVGKMAANVAVISNASFKALDETNVALSTLTIKWQSPKTKYGVFRVSDNECLQNGFETKPAAMAWAAEHEAAMAA